ncbi:MAG: hypothetical protein IJZ44_08630 [Lachnospiraceae bacterium]|nr:hypothetical protein [Lachnospiraceae bacterium]
MNDQVKDYSKKLMDCISSKIDSAYTKMQQKKLQEALQREYLAKREFANYAQYQLQDALFHILSCTTIAPQLCPLQHASDLLPVGSTIRAGDTTIYYYAWTKNDPSTRIPYAVVQKLSQKMNMAIRSELRKLEYAFHSWDGQDQIDFIYLHPALYNGFHVLGCEDKGAEIVLAVEYL